MDFGGVDMMMKVKTTLKHSKKKDKTKGGKDGKEYPVSN
jgi:hypothetical protein